MDMLSDEEDMDMPMPPASTAAPVADSGQSALDMLHEEDDLHIAPAPTQQHLPPQQQHRPPVRPQQQQQQQQQQLNNRPAQQAQVSRNSTRHFISDIQKMYPNYHQQLEDMYQVYATNERTATESKALRENLIVLIGQKAVNAAHARRVEENGYHRVRTAREVEKAWAHVKVCNNPLPCNTSCKQFRKIYAHYKEQHMPASSLPPGITQCKGCSLCKNAKEFSMLRSQLVLARLLHGKSPAALHAKGCRDPQCTFEHCVPSRQFMKHFQTQHEKQRCQICHDIPSLVKGLLYEERKLAQQAARRAAANGDGSGIGTSGALRQAGSAGGINVTGYNFASVLPTCVPATSADAAAGTPATGAKTGKGAKAGKKAPRARKKSVSDAGGKGTEGNNKNKDSDKKKKPPRARKKKPTKAEAAAAAVAAASKGGGDTVMSHDSFGDAASANAGAGGKGGKGAVKKKRAGKGATASITSPGAEVVVAEGKDGVAATAAAAIATANKDENKLKSRENAKTARQKKVGELRAARPMCQEAGCDDFAYGKTSLKCRNHLGGPCKEPGCTTSARLQSEYCVAHKKNSKTLRAALNLTKARKRAEEQGLPMPTEPPAKKAKSVSSLTVAPASKLQKKTTTSTKKDTRKRIRAKPNKSKTDGGAAVGVGEGVTAKASEPKTKTKTPIKAVPVTTSNRSIKSKNNNSNRNTSNNSIQKSNNIKAPASVHHVSELENSDSLHILPKAATHMRTVNEDKLNNEDMLMSVAGLDGDILDAEMGTVGDDVHMSAEALADEGWEMNHVLAPGSLWDVVRREASLASPGMKVGSLGKSSNSAKVIQRLQKRKAFKNKRGDVDMDVDDVPARDLVEVEYLSHCAHEFMINALTAVLKLAKHRGGTGGGGQGHRFAINNDSNDNNNNNNRNMDINKNNNDNNNKIKNENSDDNHNNNDNNNNHHNNNSNNGNGNDNDINVNNDNNIGIKNTNNNDNNNNKTDGAASNDKDTNAMDVGVRGVMVQAEDVAAHCLQCADDPIIRKYLVGLDAGLLVTDL